MTNKEKALMGLDAAIRDGAKAWNDAYKARDMDAMHKVDETITENVKEYAEVAQAICFEELHAKDKPMYEAIKKLTFETLRVKSVADKESGHISREVVVIDRQIDLLKFDKFGGKDAVNVSYDPTWHYKIQKFNQLLTLRAAEELKIDPESVSKSYYMSEKAKEIKMGGTPTSNTQILKLLQECVDAIIYEDGARGNIYKASSKDVAYLLMVYTRKGRNALTAATAKHGAMRGLVTEICHRIITDKAYKLDYKQVKKEQD